MKRILFLSLALTLLLLGFEFLGSSNCSIAQSNNKITHSGSTTSATLSLKITGMTCQNCAQTIQRSLNKDNGVTLTNIKYKNAVNTVNYNPSNTNETKIISEIENSGYKAEKVDNKSHKFGTSKLRCADGCSTNK